MKKKLLFFVVFALCVTTLCSCKLFNKNKGNSGDNSAKGLIYGNGENAHIICDYKNTVSKTNTEKWISELRNRIDTVAGYTAYLIEPTGPADGHEIVIGDTGREITAKAKELLAARIRRETNALEYDLPGWDKLVGYAVYSDGNSVAIVWSDFQLEEAAIKYFAEKFVVADKLELEPGYIKTEVFNFEKFLLERATEVKIEQWAELEKQLPAEYASGIITSLKSLYELYNVDMVRWLANLYDPQIVIVDSEGNPVPEYNQEGNEIYGGGWYHSNSARDNDGFLPDIENTYVALSFVAATGMAELYDDNWVPAMPQWLKTQVGLWFQNLQDPDTFFYHPQWPKDFIVSNGLQSRITRDRNSARTVLKALGYQQLYPQAVASNSRLPGKLSSNSAVVAASKVVPAADMLWQYQSAENFRIYLDGLEKELLSYTEPNSRAGRFYYYGNLFQSTTSYINNFNIKYDANGKVISRDPTLKNMLVEFFDKYQNPENGLWSDILCYNATNGIHKIGAVYNGIGAEMKYVDKMTKSCMEIISWTVEEHPIGAGVDIYNAWSCLPYIYQNIRNSNTDTVEAEKKVAEIKELVFASAAQTITSTRNQVAGFRRADGSYGYSRYGASQTAQGCPAAIAGTHEGDVNGNAIASLDVILYIMKALELEEYMVNMFTEYERMEFVHILNNLGPVIKYDEELGEDVLHDFEDIEEGDLPKDYSTELDAGRDPIDGTFAKVTEIDGNRVLEVVAKHRGENSNARNLYLRAPIYLVRNGANMASIEFDICMLSEGTLKGGSLLQMNVTGAGSPVLYPWIGVDSSGNVYFADSNNKKIANIGVLDEPISLRIEYFWLEGVYRVYSDNIYVGGGTETYNKRAHQEVQSIAFGAPSTATAHYWIDNVRMLRTAKEYVDESAATSPEHSFNGEADGTPVKGFIGNGVLVIPYGGSANYAGDGETLELHGSSFGSPISVTVPAFTAEGIMPNTASVSLDLKLGSLSGGNMKIALLDGGSKIITALGFAESADGTKIIGTHYGADLLTSLKSFYTAENLEGKDDITLTVTYSYNTGVMKVTVGDTEYTAIVGVIESFKGIRVLVDGADTNVELVEGRLENLFVEATGEEVKVDPTPEDYDGEYTSRIENWDCTHKDHNGMPGQSVTNLYFPSGASAVFSTLSSYSNTHGAVAEVVSDVFSDNKYLNITAPKRISARDRAHGLNINAQKCVLDPNVYIVETDMKLDSVLPDGTATHDTYLKITFTNDTVGKYVMIILTKNAAKVTIAGVELADWDTWFKLRMEYYPAEGKLQFYVNNKFKGEIAEGYSATDGADKSFASLGNGLTKVTFAGANSAGAGFSMNFDNSMLYGTTGEYVGGRVPEADYPDGPNYETFDRVVEYDGIGNTIKGKTGTAITFPADKTNKCGAHAFHRVEEEIANSFVTIYSPARVDTNNDRAHGVSIPITTLCGDPNVFVLEASLRLNSLSEATNYIQINFSHESDGKHFGQLNMSIKDGVASFGGVKVGYLDEWFDLKIEFYLTDGKMKVYNGDLFIGEITTFSDASTEAKLVSELTGVTSVAINGYNGGGMFYFNIDNVAAYRTNITYTEETANDLLAPSPDVDDFDPTVFDDNTGNEGGTTPDVGGEDIVNPGDNVTLPDIDVPDGEIDDDSVGEWTEGSLVTP